MRPFQLIGPLTQTTNITSGTGTSARFATPVGPFLVVSGNNELRAFNASVDPGHPATRFAAVGSPLNVTAYGSPTIMCPRPGPGLGDRLLVSHGTGGVVEYSINTTTGTITYLGQRVTVGTAGVVDSGSMVCAPSWSSGQKTIYCFNSTWGLVATVTMPATDYFNWTVAVDTNLPGQDYKVWESVCELS